ncbi:MAG: chondroitinase family polysaccharide lyase, partial [Verrucomicrobiota bacterium]
MRTVTAASLTPTCFFVLLVGVLFALVGCSDSRPSQEAPLMESFESGIPASLNATGNLSLDTLRMKHGAHSLKWKWRGNDRLVIDVPVGYRKQRKLSASHGVMQNTNADREMDSVLEPPRGVFMWIYNEHATPQRVRIEFGRGDVVDCWFDYYINFKGWRSLAVCYDRGDMKGAPREDMNRMTIHAPNTGTCTFYIDMLGLSVTMNPRTVNANPQLPHIDPHSRLVTQYEHNLYYFSKLTPTLNLEPLRGGDVAEFRKLEDKAIEYWLTDEIRQKWNDSHLAKLKELYEKEFCIKRDGKKIYGRPLLNFNVIKDHFNELGLSKDEQYEQWADWRHDLCGMLLKIAVAWGSTDNSEVKAELETMFMDLFDYGIDQGFDVGAGLGWIHHYSYVIREYAPAMLIMKEALERHDRLDKAIEICKWFYGFNRVYREDEAYGWTGRKACDADDMQGLLTQRLVTALLMRDTPEKLRDLKHFTSYFSNVSTAYANGLDETFKPDGTIFHHAGHAYGYGGRALNGAIRTYNILEGTDFQASDEAFARILKVTQTYYAGLFTEKLMAPKAFATIRFSNYSHPKPFGDLLGALDQNTEPFDGFRSLSYSCVSLKRQQDDWMITARTHSKFVYPWEGWGISYFAYPLFIAHGYLDVSYPDSLDSFTPETGLWHEGIDWRRWSGTTTVKLPYEKMLTRVGQVRDEGGEYLFSDQPFSGGVETSYGAGIHVFQFKGHDKYGLETFTGKKTWFFYENKVVCLGTDIQFADDRYEVETTIFQNNLNSPDESVVVSGKRVSEFPFDEQYSAGEPLWLIDNRNTGYFLPEGNVRLTRVKQTNPNRTNAEQVSGNFATAWLSHGTSPESAAYSYVLLADTNEDEMKGFAQNPTYEILQQDSAAHVVAMNEREIMAYAVYQPSGTNFSDGLVKSVGVASSFVVKQEGQKIRLSVSNPDLNIYAGQEDLLPDGSRTELSIYEREWFFWQSRPIPVRIVLNGKW